MLAQTKGVDGNAARPTQESASGVEGVYICGAGDGVGIVRRLWAWHFECQLRIQSYSRVCGQEDGTSSSYRYRSVLFAARIYGVFGRRRQASPNEPQTRIVVWYCRAPASPLALLHNYLPCASKGVLFEELIVKENK